VQIETTGTALPGVVWRGKDGAIAGDHAECLLTTDAASVDEAAAAARLAALKSSFENPLRLFV
jgi:hypothetical protein